MFSGQEYMGEFIITVILAIFAAICAIFCCSRPKIGGGGSSGANSARNPAWTAAVQDHIRKMYKGAALGCRPGAYGDSAAEISAKMRVDNVTHAEFDAPVDRNLVEELAAVGLSVVGGVTARPPASVISGGDLCGQFIDRWRRGTGYFALLISTVESIAAASGAPAEKMLDQWRANYAVYMHDGSKYALDQNLKWYTECADPAVVQRLQEKCEQFMTRAYSEFRAAGPAAAASRIAAGMRLYSEKPNLGPATTWTTGEYNLPEFQMTYIRLKSLQRYSECYSTFEIAFGGMSDDDLRGIKRVVSIGGGCGFELFALRDYLASRVGVGMAAPTCTIVDVAETWKKYADLIECEYHIEDVNECGPETVRAIGGADLVIFSYVYRYLTARFFELVEKKHPAVRLIFNERRLRVRDGFPSARQINENMFVRGLPAAGHAALFTEN